MDAPSRPPLRGRQQELAVIRRKLSQVRAGTGGVIVVEGSAGLGKTRLLDECVSMAAELSFLVGRGAAEPGRVIELGAVAPVFSHIEVADGRVWMLPSGAAYFCGDLSEEEQELVWATITPRTRTCSTTTLRAWPGRPSRAGASWPTMTDRQSRAGAIRGQADGCRSRGRGPRLAGNRSGPAVLADQHAPRVQPPQAPSTGWAALTRAEREVARLVAQGKTNREIADHLFVSPHTVNSHLRHIFAKVGVRSRVQLASATSQSAE